MWPEEHIVFEQPGLQRLRAGFIFHDGVSLPSAITYGWGGGGYGCVVIGLEKITPCLKSDCFIIGFYSKRDLLASKASPVAPGGRMHTTTSCRNEQVPIWSRASMSFLQFVNDGVRNVKSAGKDEVQI